MQYIKEFKAKDLTDRKRQAMQQITKYPSRVPVVIDKYKTIDPDLCTSESGTIKHKFLFPRDSTFGFILNIVRQRTELTKEDALYMHVVDSNTMPTVSKTIRDIYNEHKDKDGFLYLTYTMEKTYGNV